MKEQTEACAAFFRERPGYQRILSALRQKYQRYGRPAGMVCLPDASEEECQAARAIFGRSFLPPLKFQITEFENELRHTYPDVSLKKVLELYFGAEIRTKNDLRQARDRRLSDLLMQATQAAQGMGSRRWLEALAEHRIHHTLPGGGGRWGARRPRTLPCVQEYGLAGDKHKRPHSAGRTQRLGRRRPPCAGQRDTVRKAVPSSVGLLL